MAHKLLNLYQLSDGYCYNTDSLLLAFFAREFLKPRMRLLDIGAGCGILGLLCAREVGDCTLEMVELEQKACFLARKNAQNTDFAKNALVHNCNIFDFTTPTLFDFVISNPPFYNIGILKSPNERKNLARVQDSMPLDLFFKHIKRLLKPRGNLVLCYDARESGRLFYELFKAGFCAQNARFVYPLANRNASLLLLQAKIDYKGALNLLPPLFTHNSPNQQDNTSELKAVYEWAKTKSIKIESSAIGLDDLKQI
ncbi:tRNA1(Val) (adenine(37)-N6)-methyltransferase [Helicobacter himalayensis]|uniref:tRNA1(Val) (adenine(37)-N6)-methyltransferase n=1 Tax=Helicobacter himalayensis TaxID=1591088 RepID=UPI003D6E68BD